MNKNFGKILNFIDGKFVNSSTGESLELSNPATRESIGSVCNSTSKDIDSALSAAEKAFPSWSKMTPRTRAEMLRKVSQEILKRHEEFAIAESLNSGKTLQSAIEIEIPRSAYNFEFFADAITQLSSESYSNLESNNFNLKLLQPLGSVVCISPWNLPLYLLTWKIAPALAAGNCVVAKPSEITPVTAKMLCEVFNAAGIPPGVLNVVHGQGSRISTALCSDPRIKALSFTGSTATGRAIAQTAAPHFKKMALEMGGKNATVVFGDCNFQRAVQETARAAFSNAGQICLCGSRILVEESIYERFQTALLEEIKKYKLGNPLDPNTKVGALVSEQHFDKVTEAVKRALAEGAKILCGGKRGQLPRPFEHGFFFEPTLLSGLGPHTATNQEEIFGPVATLQSFSTEDEALQLTNATQYGLSASLWTQDISKAHRVAARMETGIVWINSWMNRDLRTPFGGVKNSGVGREGGVEALKFFSEIKNICVDYSQFPTLPDQTKT
jgi:aminomuconate-semialdehyde/2-hydroxymuconate-6-semialdehyde dehydrogenase